MLKILNLKIILSFFFALVALIIIALSICVYQKKDFLEKALKLYYGDQLLSAYFSHINCPSSKFSHYPSKKYYSQYYEDYVLSYVLADIKKGFYIDVGANNPNKKNATKYFYEQGWRGINIDAQEKYYQMLLEFRPEDININKAISDVSGMGDFYVPKSDSIATMEYNYGIDHKEYVDIKQYKVEMITLNLIFKPLNLKEVDLLKIDIEGSEFRALKGLDLDSYRPKIIVVESVSPLNFYGYLQFEPLLFEHGYKLGMNDDLNRYYYRRENSEFAGKFRDINKCVVLDKMIRGISCQNENNCKF